MHTLAVNQVCERQLMLAAMPFCFIINIACIICATTIEV